MVKLLSGVKVIELAGLAPVPLCGMILADFGADVTIIERKDMELIEQRLDRGKTTRRLDLKNLDDLREVREMCRVSDVLLDPYRPGVLEKIGLSPESLLEDNQGLVICRITGYGQDGPLSKTAGHDINYVALSGMLPTFAGKEASRPWPPVNMLADFAGGSLTAAFGIVAALHARTTNGGNGCVLDCSMTEGVAYLASFVQHYNDQPHLFNGKYAVFDGECPIYRTYKTKDNKFMAVGPLEPKFHVNMFETLGIKHENLFEDPEKLIKQLEDIFLTKTRDEWSEIFKAKDCCVTPVLDIDEVGEYSHHVARANFEKSEKYGGSWIAKPAPRVLTLEDLKNNKSKL